MHDSLDSVDLYSDFFAVDLLPDWSDPWVEPERESYRQLRLHALETLSRRLAEANRTSEALEAGLMAVSAAPFRETAHQAVIRALVVEGNRGEAVCHYQRLCVLFERELGIKPSFLLEDMFTEASAGDTFSDQ
jgi:DNA-binding SARP family transcriptional activator